jgi:hypothetical protein
MKTKKYKINKRKSRKIIKGGVFNSIFTRQPLTTQQQLDILKNNIDNQKIKDIENQLQEDLTKLSNLRKDCIKDCKTAICSGNDAVQCQQMDDMINTKTDYEWGNLCNAVNVEKCKEYLSTFKKLEFNINYINSLNNKLQTLFNNYKTSITPKNK